MTSKESSTVRRGAVGTGLNNRVQHLAGRLPYGDLMRDPEIVFEVSEGQWQPVSIQQDYVGSYREAVSIGGDGKLYVRPAEVADIQAFARVWDRNIKAQGFVDVAINRADAV